ncbi:RNA polymerase sigma factor, sigma-70 family [Streptomyces sp. BpilaLS-43]|uniref:sigma-70 family RNA polymerase sigma factor n=1 Tax=Streptomyces sp. BpilaLS-43 TaxID=1839778 RepID=UPI00081B7993|nr:sigma-70 family RNA polymerase sigma factor [Streptomyces sp. BpilaLS-43]SCD95083.1 RNA polymerase sigma factor, sigma-70 family [Streptomyces sp. BpilaLS-43]
MGETRETALIKAAQQGDEQAQERLVSSYLPLAYNIVGRALNGHADVDDVVQESVLRMLRGLPGLRAPESFRSWFVAITMNEIRRHWRERRTGEISADRIPEAQDVVDPSADFVELTIVRLGLTGQRRETAEATRWLDDDDRDLLSLWWLETAGELTRNEVARALELSPQHTAVRVQRMKAQLDASRVVVRALAAHPRCVLLEDLTASWDGVPSALWRKRLARHARDCTVCSGHRSGLVPAEGLLAGLVLVPPVASASVRPADFLPVSDVTHTSGPGRAERRRGRARRRRRNTVVAALVAVGTLGGGGTAVHLYTDDTDEGPASAVESLAGPADAAAPPVSPSVSASASPSPAPTSASPSPSASPPRSRSASPTPEATPTRRPPSSRPSAPSVPSPTKQAPASVAEEVTALVNSERAKEGCEPVSGNSLLDTAASRHSADMAERDYFSHTSPDGTDPGDRITAAGYRWSTYGENIAKGQTTPAAVMESWMNSPGHRANILNCAFKEIGVGRQDSSGGPVWTQNFGAAL